MPPQSSGPQTSPAQNSEEAPQQGLKRLSLEDLGKVPVTIISKEPLPAFRTPAAIYVLTQEDIRRSGVTNIPDALRLVPGVEVAQIDSAKWAIGIRGFEGRLARDVLVLIDGRSVYTPLFAGVYWEMQDTLLEDIERIEVIRGPGGAVWGPNAVNGVINIITKSSKDTRGSLLSAGGGNVEQGFGNARYGAREGRFNYRLWSKIFTRGPEFHTDGRNFDDWRRTQAGFRTDWDSRSQRDSFTVQGDAYESTVGTKLGLSFFSPPSLLNVEGNGYFFGANLVGRWRRQISAGSDLQFQAYYDRTDRRDLNAREIRDTFDFDFVHHVSSRRNDFTWGVDERLSPSEFIPPVATVDFLPHDQTYRLFSGFLQNEFKIVPERFSLTLGTKFEHNSFNGWDAQPSGRFLWTPTKKQTYWAAISRVVRTPSRIEDNFIFSFFASPAPLFLRLIGDGHFDSETMNGYELGMRRLITPRLAVAATGFYNQYDNLESVESRPVFAETTPGPPHLVLPLFLRNGVRGNTKGAEINGAFDVTSWWRLRAAYSYVRMDMRNATTSNDASTVRQLEGDTPGHKGTVQSAFDLGRAVEFNLTYRFVSGVPDQNIAAYSTADARLAWRLRRDLEFAVTGQNLLQPYHFEYGGDPTTPVGIRRAVYGKITWTK